MLNSGWSGQARSTSSLRLHTLTGNVNRVCVASPMWSLSWSLDSYKASWEGGQARVQWDCEAGDLRSLLGRISLTGNVQEQNWARREAARGQR